ncbi:MAG: hypothetical protein JO163_10975 [Methylobacteriaceae bacterium]|nr:hypothetical protein [Methylobacteriaceae bacterium]MBV9703241.1 hypothetical protein [Methylobacteriaceae bacterium]
MTDLNDSVADSSAWVPTLTNSDDFSGLGGPVKGPAIYGDTTAFAFLGSARPAFRHNRHRCIVVPGLIRINGPY